MTRKIKILALLLMVPMIFGSCKIKVPQMTKFGSLSVASTKNVDLDAEYVLIARNAGFDASQALAVNKKEVKAFQNATKKIRKRQTRKRVSNRTRKKIRANYYRLAGATIDQAINNVVEETAGGMFMENVELYYTGTGRKTMYIVSGDVYGKEGVSRNIRGFIVGTKALYKKRVGTVATLTDDQYCLWKDDRTGKFTEVLYDDLTKIGE